MIAIVDYGMGNLRSVEKGFQKVGVDARVVSDAKSIENAQAVVLPGVGAFRDCMRNLDALSLIEPIAKSIASGKPYLGICLGLQLLFTESEEFGNYKGLDILPGKVVRFRIDLKVPHMGWNTVSLLKRPPIFEDIPDNSYVYFVHSYFVAPADPAVTAGMTEYGISFTSMIWKENIVATQFHPEKSQETGLRILRNFGDWVKKA
ncbi:MAG: imidazole glycerol phosphate synthase subunit HisH [Thermodesulfovibrionales bacterium]|nr:imidazole glycerol phosphate synthase subunit HisH [Thermodesulfovibrionales bacterium]